MTSEKATNENATPDALSALRRRHLRLGWWCLVLFGAFGILLEVFHGLKSGYYLNVSNETRRLMWRLAHTHGTLLALVNVGFALSLPHLRDAGGAWARRASVFLVGAQWLLPGGFLLGGVVVQGADPSPGIFLVPVGALLLVLACLGAARRA